MAHKFTLDQIVVFSPAQGDIHNVPMNGRITRLLPKEGTEYQYHFQSSPDGQLRMAKESQLRLAATPI